MPTQEDLPNPKTTSRLFLIFLFLGFLVLAGCFLQSKFKDSNTNADATTSQISGKDIKDGYVGKFYSTPEGSQFDDYFKTSDNEYGIEAVATALIIKLNELKDTDAELIIWGKLIENVPDYGGHQILVSKIKVPSQNFELEWQTYTNDDLGISFQYPKYTVFEVKDNTITFDGWGLELLNNPKSLGLQEWLDSNFSEAEEPTCKLESAKDFSIGLYPTYEVSVGEAEECEELGIFAITQDKQKIIKLVLAQNPSQNYKEIIQTFRFIKPLNQDEIDLNETKKNGSGSDGAGLANPASVYCEEQGGKLEIRTDEKTQGQYGVCIFADQTECEEWAFYRGECQAGASK